jgi:hypothetical protein
VTQTKNGTTGSSTSDLTPEDDQWIDHLADLWKTYEQKGLEVRMEMGDWLNKRLGPPTKRQAHGGHVLQMVEEKLDIDQYTLNRVRWFAHYFESIEGFEKQHPGVTSWTRVREIIADRNAVGKDKERKRSKSCGNGASSATVKGTAEQSSVACDRTDDKKHDDPVVAGISQLLSDLTAKFRQLENRLEGTAREDLRKKFAQLTEAAEIPLGVRWTNEDQKT